MEEDNSEYFNNQGGSFANANRSFHGPNIMPPFIRFEHQHYQQPIFNCNEGINRFQYHRNTSYHRRRMHYQNRVWYPNRMDQLPNVFGARRAYQNEGMHVPVHFPNINSPRMHFSPRKVFYNRNVRNLSPGPIPTVMFENNADIEEYVPMPMKRNRRVSSGSLSSNNGQDYLRYSPESDYDNDRDVSSITPPLAPLNNDIILLDDSSTKDYCASAYIAAVIQSSGRAAFGVFFGNDNALNFGALLPESHPHHCLKSALIYGGAECVKSFKQNGSTSIVIRMESDYLVKNVAQWLEKASNEGFKKDDASNWDEFKYAEEIDSLCRSFHGMRINWVHLSSRCEGTEHAKSLAINAIPLENSDSTVLDS